MSINEIGGVGGGGLEPDRKKTTHERAEEARQRRELKKRAAHVRRTMKKGPKIPGLGENIDEEA